MRKTLIFNIQKFCIHDGPGIRTTVFFKGCPLKCSWCHNPESQNSRQEMLYDKDKCSLCGQCARHCQVKAISITNGKILFDPHKCRLCKVCIDVCSNNAREIAGEEYSVAELMREIEKDRPFYEQSGGGVTLSGGEAMVQIDFVAELVATCRERGIAVAIDTCGQAPTENFLRIMEYVDIFLYDIKLLDPARHRDYTGQDNRLILDNLKVLSDQGANINLRLPLLAGVNDGPDHICRVIRLIQNFNISSINLLPYHDIGQGKYRKLARDYPAEGFDKPPAARVAEIKAAFEQENYQVKIGG
ncbi:MAG TPA: glycyl-radical enzyme activating protein [Methylomusa anaerophila]|uniref:Benzylsuccinate synthase activating enzyme n=1 Tax=Methylomusa anaerophila TaxID=1930071 RepID=A0A348ALX7_9FIRM|nr:trans-4-hydroxy-L-proline dehydratase activase [Methylomusa anaerophila]BBB92075.1 benzylsuccinate synthase activating enzyme [Methylomusa anaerophila]HML87912.1 glycyl-radical enzyme activating protein [Methylomusa anaerophila]